MRITRLRGGNSQFPTIKSTEDIVVLSNRDMFCWDGKMWQIIGGRFLPAHVCETFLSYIAEGFPDEETLHWDLHFLLNTENVIDSISKESVPENILEKEEEERDAFCRGLLEKFISRVIEVGKICQKNSSTFE